MAGRVFAGRREDRLHAAAQQAIPTGERGLQVATDVREPALIDALFGRTIDPFRPS